MSRSTLPLPQLLLIVAALALHGCGKQISEREIDVRKFAERIMKDIEPLKGLDFKLENVRYRQMRFINYGGGPDAGVGQDEAVTAVFDGEISGKPNELSLRIVRQGLGKMQVRSLSLTHPASPPPLDELRAAREVLRREWSEQRGTTVPLPRLHGWLYSLSYDRPGADPVRQYQFLYNLPKIDATTSATGVLIATSYTSTRSSKPKWRGFLTDADRAGVEWIPGFVKASPELVSIESNWPPAPVIDSPTTGSAPGIPPQ